MNLRRHRPTERDRRRVELLTAAGKTPDEIAAVFNITKRQLRQRFSDELRNGAARVEATAIERLDTGAKNGNAASARLLTKIVQHARKQASKPKRAAKPAPVTLSDDEVAMVAHLRSQIWESVLGRATPPRHLLQKLVSAEIDGNAITQRMHDRAVEILEEKS